MILFWVQLLVAYIDGIFNEESMDYEYKGCYIVQIRLIVMSNGSLCILMKSNIAFTRASDLQTKIEKKKESYQQTATNNESVNRDN